MIQCQGLKSSLTLDMPISGNSNLLVVVITGVTLWCDTYLNLATKYSILLSANSIRAHTPVSYTHLDVYKRQVCTLVIGY